MRYLCLVMLLAIAQVKASYVYDDFDDGVVSGSWQISGAYLDTYTLVESGSSLSLDAMTSTSTTERWTNLYLSQAFNAMTGSFHIDFMQSFAQNEAADKPYCQLWLYSGTDLRGYVGTADSSATGWGNPIVYLKTASPVTFAGTAFSSGSGTLDWDIDRDESGLITVQLNGGSVKTAVDLSGIDMVRIAFQGRDISGWDWSASSPSMSVDFINVVPEPATVAILGLGAALIRRKK